MTDPDLVRNPVEILAEEFLERYRRGERPTLTEYVDRHPELSEEIREVFPSLLAIEGATPHAAACGSAGHAPLRGDGFMPERLGDFRIVAEIGRGGMGVVYEAVQESLGRQVALKVLPLGALADPAALKRFRREARSVAALHHSNIVPVFGIGEHDGHHYYAMQLIRGQTLEGVLGGVRRLRDVAGPVPTMSLTVAQSAATEIAGCLLTDKFARVTADRGGEPESPRTTEFPPASESIEGRSDDGRIRPLGSDFTTATIAERGESHYHRRVAKIGLQVAEALGYAHDQGVLHRDIKPSNLLMDGEGTVWVLDFGLARAEATDEQSASRDIVGTLRYMAPERFDGRSDIRSDVYGLGATLYELLTLRPAFDAAGQAALIHQVLHGIPASPRQIDRRIPRDLETIILKAMAREPQARYPSAHALGDDLRRFLENRTILARRSTSLERTSRWCRRNPAIAALLTLVVALLAFIAGYSSVSATRYRHQFERASAAEIDGRKKLFTSYVAQAQASRFSRRPGQRFAALRALAEAAKIHRTPDLRDEAIACLALPDLDLIHRSNEAFRGIKLVFDPSLERYARLDWDGIVSVQRIADDGVVRRYPSPGPVGESFVLAFSPDGRHLAVTYRLDSGVLLKVWRLDRELPALVLDGPAPIYLARFTPDGLQVAVGRMDGSVVFHDLASGRAGARWDAGRDAWDFAFSPDGRKVAVSLDGDPTRIKIRAFPSGDVIREINVPAACRLDWGPDSTALAAACADSRIYLYDADTGLQTGALAVNTNQGIFTSFQPAGALLASNGWDGRLRLWRPRTGEMLLSLPAAGELNFRGDGLRFATQTHEHYPVLFEVDDGRAYRSLVQVPVRRRDFTTCSALHPGGRLLAIGMTNGVGLWDIDRDMSVASLPIGQTESLLFEPSGDLVTLSRIGLARWPVRHGPDGSNSLNVGPPALLSKQTANKIAGSRDGRLLGVCTMGETPFVSDRDHPEAPICLGPQDDVRSIAISPDGRWAATGSFLSRDGVKVWSLPGGRIEKQFSNAGWQASVLFSPDGRWLAMNLGSKVSLWSVGDWREGPGFEGGALSFSSDGRLLAIAQPVGSVQLVETATGRLVASLDDPNQARSKHATFTADGSRLILGGQDSRMTHVWDLRSIRRDLVAIGLDWEWAPFPEPGVSPQAAGPLRVVTDFGGHDFSWGASTPHELDRLSDALEIDSGDLHAMLRRGHIYITTGSYDQAIADYTRALAIRPGDPRILAERGQAYLLKKEYAPGFADCEASLETLPDQGSVHNQLAWVYAMSPPPLRDPANALNHARQAVRLSPAIGTYHNTLGIALYRSGQYREAVNELETSLAESSPQDSPWDLFFLAMCRAHLGDTGRAKIDFERASRLQAKVRGVAGNVEELLAIRHEAEAVLGDAPKRQVLPGSR